MKKVSLDVWIQLRGMIGVFASLVFVGLQMRQSLEIALAAQQTERIHRTWCPDPLESAKVILERTKAFFSTS